MTYSRSASLPNASVGVRYSNFELLRIILTLFVIGHHYVVNSGLMECFDYNNITGNMIFLKFYSIFGKISVNVFGLITGFFMVHSTWRWQKWLKLYLEAKFYGILFYALFVVFGYMEYNHHDLLVTLFSTVMSFGNGYTATFLVFHLFIPFLNILLHNMTQKQHLLLIGLLVSIYTGISTFSYFLSLRAVNNDTWNYLGWMVCLYLIGAYFSQYRCVFFENRRLMRAAFLLNTLLSWASILVIDFVGRRVDFGYWFWLVNDSHKLLALTGAIFLFCWFRTVQIPHHPAINKLASTTFGVFLIHSINVEMRVFLWHDILHCTDFYNSDYLIPHALLSTVGIFIVCSCIDLIRQRFLEKPFFGHFPSR